MSDPRFAQFNTDPRFRRPKKHRSKVVVDDRFKDFFDGKSGREEAGRLPASVIPDYARGGILVESSESEAEDQGARESDNDDDDEEEEEEEEEGESDADKFEQAAAACATSAALPKNDNEEALEKSRRLAVVNLDWDHVRAAHLHKIFSSLVSPGGPASDSMRVKKSEVDHNGKGTMMAVTRGKVLSVRVYPSEFGKERIAREEKEGPPAEVFKQKTIENEVDVDEQTIYETGGGADYDEDALRNYQLERLRYYYAIVECDAVETAVRIYDELEGTELERSANVFDLSFVPDEMVFDEECRDEATYDPGTRYRAIEFVTDALRHSKVKLTWDDDDPERNHITRRPLTKKEIAEADFRAYIASSSSESDEGTDPALKKGGQKTAQRDKLRALLLGGHDDELPEGWGGDDESKKYDDVDMEITFTPGFTEAKNPEDETTMEKYQRKMKEKRKKRKEETKVKAVAVGDVEGGKRSGKKVSLDDDFFEDASGSGNEAERALKSTKRISKPVDDDESAPHQEIKSSNKTEKKGRKKKGKKKPDGEDDEVEDEFVVDVKDARFKAIHEDYQFAIDPSNPHFKKTKSMVALLDERTKRQKRRDPEGERRIHVLEKVGDSSLNNLVESVKRKSAAAAGQGVFGKRRKVIT